MFSSNQVFEISGCIDHKNDLKNALEFAIKASGWYEPFTRSEKPAKCTFQITENGTYCLGWHAKEGWSEFQFDFDIEIIAQIITQHLKKQHIIDEGGDGSYHKGFLIKQIDWKSNVKNHDYGIIAIEPFTCYYAK